jgi:hypothetical protein
MGQFNVFNPDTWQYASDNIFVWRNSTFTNPDNQKLTEKDITPYISEIINRVQICVTPNININQAYYTWNNVISDCLDGLLAGKELKKISSEILIKVMTVPLEDENFDILYPDTWHKATDKDFFWKGEPVTNTNTDKPVTEYQMALHFQKQFESLAKDRSPLTMREKRDYILQFFDQAVEDAKKNDEKPEPTGEFDILDTNTWDNASEKQLVWQGQPLKMANGNPLSEIEAVSFLVPLIQFMGKKKQLEKDYVKKIINNTLNKLLLNDGVPKKTK